jgi:gluconate 2-dehydrogenase gamma chain
MRLGRITRREAFSHAGKAGAAGALAITLPPGLFRGQSSVLTPSHRRTLRAAVARMVPASGPGDWSAADVGADHYIATLLSTNLAHPDRIYAGGPYRSHFARFQPLSRVKRIGWSREVRRLRGVYTRGLAELDRKAGGDFAAAPAAVQDAVLTEMDYAGTAFFNALYNHTLEGVYSHPVYGGNRDYIAWRAYGYLGDVHGVRFPHIGPADAPWNVYGGYAPEEMIRPGREQSKP